MSGFEEGVLAKLKWLEREVERLKVGEGLKKNNGSAAITYTASGGHTFVGPVTGAMSAFSSPSTTNYTGSNVTLVGMSYNTITTLAAGTYLLFTSFAGAVSAIICYGSTYSNNLGEVAAGSHVCLFTISSSTVIQFYANTVDTANYIYYRLKIRVVKVN